MGEEGPLRLTYSVRKEERDVSYSHTVMSTTSVYGNLRHIKNQRVRLDTPVCVLGYHSTSTEHDQTPSVNNLRVFKRSVVIFNLIFLY